MNLKVFVFLLILSASLANAEVSIQAIGGTKVHTIKISKTVVKEDLEKFQQVLEEVERKRLKLHMNAILLTPTEN